MRILLLLVMSTFCGCLSQKMPLHPGELRLNAFNEPPTLDPRLASDITSQNLLFSLFEGLTTYNQEGEVIYGMADQIDVSEDQCLYTITLKETYWSNGERVTSNDFIETWREMLQPDFPAPLAYHLYILMNAKAIKEGKIDPQKLGVYSIDDQKFALKLTHPFPSFLQTLAMPCLFPVHRKTIEYNPDWAKEASLDYVTNGPFLLTHWEHHNEIVMEKNSYYHGSNTVQLDRIHYAMVTDQVTEELLFENNELDMIGSPYSKLVVESLPRYEEQGDLQYVPTKALYLYKINTTHYPLSNLNIRKAFSYAIKRDVIATHILGGQDVPARTIIPSLPGRKAKEWFHESQDKALLYFEKGLEELGITREEFPVLNVYYNDSQDHKIIAQYLKGEWEAVFGIKIQLEVRDWMHHLSQLQSMDYDIGRQAWIGENYDPASYLEPYRLAFDNGSPGMNETGWEHPRYSTLLNMLDYETQEQRRNKLINQAEKLLMQEMPVIPLFFICYEYAKKEHLEGEFLSPLGFLDLKNAQLAPPHIVL
jgi:oligopeptide transport system substrate-binding protein